MWIIQQTVIILSKYLSEGHQGHFEFYICFFTECKRPGTCNIHKCQPLNKEELQQDRHKKDIKFAAHIVLYYNIIKRTLHSSSSSWRHQQFFPCDQLSWCAVHAHANCKQKAIIKLLFTCISEWCSIGINWVATHQNENNSLTFQWPQTNFHWPAMTNRLAIKASKKASAISSFAINFCQQKTSFESLLASQR